VRGGDFAALRAPLLYEIARSGLSARRTMTFFFLVTPAKVARKRHREPESVAALDACLRPEIPYRDSRVAHSARPRVTEGSVTPA
jgi:hypothetical protein